jgi:hypothetical protein
MTGYVRTDTTNNIADGNIINATDLDNEFDGVQAAFNSSTGHNHDGTTGEGAPILVLGPTQDVVVGAAAVTPKTTNTVDIGSGSLKFKDLFLAGNASVGGTLAVTGVATLTAQPVLSSLTASSAVATDASKGLVSVTNTGTGNNVLATSPTLVTPALGTPSSATLTNATGLPIGTGVSGLGTGVATALAVNVGTAGSPVVNGGVLGTPSSATLTNATGLPVATGISGLGSGVATFLATPSSANLAAAVSDETGTGALVFANSPTFVTPALGTPASGVVTNLTGTASININGTVGATTASTGAFTTLTTSSTVTLNGGTANGVAFLDASKVLTTGSALTFDGTNLGIGTSSPFAKLVVAASTGGIGMEVVPNGSDGGTLVEYYNRGTAAYTPFRQIASYHRFDVGVSEQMRLTSTGLGIGTSSPGSYSSRLVSVSQAGGAAQSLDAPDGTNTALNWYSNGTAKWTTQVLTTGEFRFFDFTAAATRLIIDSSGNLGLGVTPSAWGSSFRTAIQNNWAALAGLGSTSLMELSANQYINSSGSRIYIGTGAATLYQHNAGLHAWFTAPSGTAGNAISFTQAMTLDASGNLGVGTTNPSGFSSKFAVVGNASVTAGNQFLFWDSTNTYVYTISASGDALTFGKSGVGERARIDSSGELLVGLTSATGVAKLQVSGALRTTGFTVATLPAGTVGMRTYVTDALAPSFGVAVAGSGAVTIPVFYDGANWIVA